MQCYNIFKCALSQYRSIRACRHVISASAMQRECMYSTKDTPIKMVRSKCLYKTLLTQCCNNNFHQCDCTDTRDIDIVSKSDNCTKVIEGVR